MKVIACIEDPLVMLKALVTLAGQALKKILTHLRGKGLNLEAAALSQSRAPPQDDLFS